MNFLSSFSLRVSAMNNYKLTKMILTVIIFLIFISNFNYAYGSIFHEFGLSINDPYDAIGLLGNDKAIPYIERLHNSGVIVEKETKAIPALKKLMAELKANPFAECSWGLEEIVIKWPYVYPAYALGCLGDKSGIDELKIGTTSSQTTISLFDTCAYFLFELGDYSILTKVVDVWTDVHGNKKIVDSIEQDLSATVRIAFVDKIVKMFGNTSAK